MKIEQCHFDFHGVPFGRFRRLSPVALAPGAASGSGDAQVVFVGVATSGYGVAAGAAVFTYDRHFAAVEGLIVGNRLPDFLS